SAGPGEFPALADRPALPLRGQRPGEGPGPPATEHHHVVFLGMRHVFPLRVNSSRSFHALAATISITTRNSGRTSRDTTRSTRTAARRRGNADARTPFLAFKLGFRAKCRLPRLPGGREQQINRSPAVGSSGSGSYFTDPEINPHAQGRQTPAPFEDSSCTSVRPTGTPPPLRTARSSRAVASGRGRRPSSPRTQSRGYRPRTPPSVAASRSAGRLRASSRRPSRPTRPPAPP